MNVIKIGKHEIPNEIGTHEIPGGKVTVSQWEVRVSSGTRGRSISCSEETRQAAVEKAIKDLRAGHTSDVRFWRTQANADKRIAESRRDEAREVERLRKKIAEVRKRAKAERSRVPKIVARYARDLAKAEKELAIVKGWSK